jgi:hypothetical protein
MPSLARIARAGDERVRAHGHAGPERGVHEAADLLRGCHVIETLEDFGMTMLFGSGAPCADLPFCQDQNMKKASTSKKPKQTTATSKRPAPATSKARSKPKTVPLLSGGNPQIPKGEGEAPVKAYLAAMPGWKRGVGRRLDALITRAVPRVRKAVKWNSPFYGVEDQGWFVSFHCFTKYVKVTFFRGTALRPVPPGESKDKDVRYLDIHEDDELDEKLVTSWIRQASKLPGWIP